MSFPIHFVLFVNAILVYRAEFTKYVVTPAIGVSGVGSAMAAYGAFDGIVSMGVKNCSSLPLVVVQKLLDCIMLASISLLFSSTIYLIVLKCHEHLLSISIQKNWMFYFLF